MSLNFAIDSKIGNRCGRTSILLDPEREQKQLEQAQRKQRLLEVREQSKEIARKIRENVAAEKERHLLNWRAAKEQEYNCWRDQVLAHHTNDNRQAIFQVGAAHRAAQLEKERMAARAAEKKANYEQFRKQLKARRSCANQENQQNKANVHKSIKKSVLTCTGTQTTCPVRVEYHCETAQPVKRKRTKCNHEKSLCCCSSDSDDSTSTEIDESSDSCSSETSSEDESDKKQRPTCSRNNTKLQKTPAVLVDVEADSSDSITITAPYEIQDKHVETNRQFSAIIRVSPSRKSKNTQKSTPAPTSAPTPAPVPTKKSQRPKSPTKAPTEPKPQKPKSPVKKSAPKEPLKPRKPRYTQISDLLQSKKAQPENPPTSPRKSRSPPPKVPPPTPKSLTPQKSPRKTGTATTATASTKSTGTKKPSSDAASNSQPASRCTAAVDTKSVGCGSGTSTGLVRFYDYNNKYTKCCPSLGTAERENPFQDQNVLNAMQQAYIEKQMRECRERELNDIQKRTEERGQMAMERERVRRDCMELTEKLDALMQQHPNLLPSDANLRPAYMAAKANARREEKSANAIEEILLRPAIITCPEVNTQEKSPNKHKSTSKRSLAYEINLGSMSVPPPPLNGAKDNANSSSNTTDSCCSILLGYVNDQSKQIRNDINECGTNLLAGGAEGEPMEKAERLRDLLQRIECLRDLLLKEINKASDSNEHVPMASDAKSMQQVIDSISSMRKERESILMEGIQRQTSKATAQPQVVSEREKELQQKEAILEQKVREFYEMQKGQEQKSVTHKIEGGCTNKPLEIIIKVKGDGKCVSKLKKSNANKAKKSPRKVAGLIQQNSSGKTPVKKTAAARIIKQTKPPSSTTRQNSYDSSSTSYRSLPPALSNEVDAMLNEFMTKTKSNRQNPQDGQQTQKPRTHINPLIAHYIQRLLGMSRKCIETLGVSSSDIQTPSSSIINTTTNRSAFSLEQQATEDELGLSQERLVCVEKFIEENRSFINELEESMRQQTNQCLEESMRVFEEIWKQRLLKTKQQKKQQQTLKGKPKATARHERHGAAANKRTSKSSNTPQGSKERGSAEKTTKPSGGGSGEQQKQKSAESMRRQQSRSPRSSAEQKLAAAKGTAKATSNDAGESSPTVSNADTRIVRYEQLTTNCTQRIAELTSLINRVREEKQRLLEVTLSSVSEGGRNSTEYMDLPADKNGKTQKPNSELLPKRLSPNQMDVEQSGEQLPSMDGAPLEKHKPTGRSRDSGISLSRPVTSLEQNSEAGAAPTVTEPSSYASNHTASSNSSSQQKTKVRPPPTLRRFSPQLSLEDDVAHELSTILEIDTPGTTRVTNASNNVKATTIQERSDGAAAALPVAFPTFEEYARQLNLDLTRMDPEKSIRIQHEFDELIANLKAAENDKNFNYEEFPSLTTYMKTAGPNTTADPAPETSADSVEELLACLRLANLTIKSFPTRNEYMEQIGAANQSSTAPAVGATSASNDTDTDSTLNIEAELKRRNIITRSFRNNDEGGGASETTTETREEVRVINSTVRSGSGETSRMCAQLLGTESGIDKLSSTTSDSTSGDLERELLSLGIKWPTTMRRKCQEADGRAQNSSTSPQPDVCCPQPQRPRQPARPREKRQLTFDDRIDCSSNADSVRPINLRDFLTRELLKHTSTSCSTTSGEDSLKSNFLNSIIGSITPGCTPPPPQNRPPWSSSSNGACRQKTSTPVVDSQSSPSRARHTCTSSTTTQLFSGESHLSSVHGESNCTNQNRRSPLLPDCNN